MNVPGHPPGIPSAALWFIAGTIVALSATRIAIAASPDSSERSALLVRSSCASGMTLYVRSDTSERFLTLREPGLYRLPAGGSDAAARIGTLTDRRSLSEVPIGTLDELVLPDTWCDGSDTSGGTAGIGLLGP